MHDHPLAINLAVTDGGAHPDIALFPVRPLSTDPVKAVAKGHAIARSDAQIANLIADSRTTG